eukprot:CAMPEP_0170511478 /NCGR_PEP_ID=MMETSP0208-20121228/66328_1 /TAXON_ID=197538 /ORGANISM="Strombidium inclinatum, Strain S3" /LENGTH=116 /DNA_ID=CAMNT_0010795027 /DNA_START=903 /DNA_END=1251 /DNA_ORIENTATION=-
MRGGILGSEVPAHGSQRSADTLALVEDAEAVQVAQDLPVLLLAVKAELCLAEKAPPSRAYFEFELESFVGMWRTTFFEVEREDYPSFDRYSLLFTLFVSNCWREGPVRGVSVLTVW